MLKATLVYNTTEIEAFQVTFKDMPSNEQLAEIFKKYRNIEILETCEPSVVSITRIEGAVLDIFKENFKA